MNFFYEHYYSDLIFFNAYMNGMIQMLNCILSMVEKTRKALGMLQQRSHANQETHHHQWKRRSASANQEMAHEASELRRQAGELIAHTLKATEDRVSQVKRKAGTVLVLDNVHNLKTHRMMSKSFRYLEAFSCKLEKLQKIRGK